MKKIYILIILFLLTTNNSIKSYQINIPINKITALCNAVSIVPYSIFVSKLVLLDRSMSGHYKLAIPLSLPIIAKFISSIKLWGKKEKKYVVNAKYKSLGYIEGLIGLGAAYSAFKFENNSNKLIFGPLAVLSLYSSRRFFK